MDEVFQFESLPSVEMQELASSFAAVAEQFTDNGKVLKKTRRAVPLDQVTKQMALLLQHDRLLNALQLQDSFILHLGREEKGALMPLIDQGKQWHLLRGQGNLNRNLRTFLVRHLMQQMEDRVGQVSRCSQTDLLWKNCVHRQIIAPDGSWLFHKWSHTDQKMIVDTYLGSRCRCAK